MKILEPHMMVLASAGSGKTYQLSNRIIGYIAMGVDPASMVALTFTRKAAGEFTDAILSKLAKASLDQNYADALRGELKQSGRDLPNIDFLSILASLIRALPNITLGTMDGFFTKVVKAFPLELGISATSFQLIEGAEAELIRENLLQSILQHDLSEEKAERFFQAFRKSLMGQECIKVRAQIDQYTEQWHGHWMTGANRLVWGPDFLAEGGSAEQWMRERDDYAAKIEAAMKTLNFNHAGQPKAWKKMVETIASHSTGSGIMAKGNSLLERIMDLAAEGAEGDQVVKSNKEFIIPADVFESIREALLCAARAEMASACESTKAIAEVISLFDEVWEQRLRSKGKFGFNDVKAKMSEWTLQEDKRLMREALDYRLDAKYQHWLLDEFQDTSRLDWNGLAPLIDEAMTNDGGSVFIVGDRKQAIYGWRGGDVTLFDDLQHHYSHLHREPMTDSYRSATEVLDLVNGVCGNLEVIDQLYGSAAKRWEWQDHQSARKQLRGHARVECIEENEEKDARLQRMVEIMREIGVGEKAMSCGVLVRTNNELTWVADYLRQHGYRVVEEGQRQPAFDQPLGVTILQLMRWLADPSDLFAEEVLRMSNLWPVMVERLGEFPWDACQQYLGRFGLAGLVDDLLEPLWENLSCFGRQRAEDLLDALRGIDQSGQGSASTAVKLLEKLKVVQSPGLAQVQVLTIHKSKGLGFDVVFLPIISTTSIPEAQQFDIARTDKWICKTPPRWARSMLPQVQAAEEIWCDQQCYEAMCVLYVALTRAKRGLYVLLDEKIPKEDSNSYARWIRDSCHGEGVVIFESGHFDCYSAIEVLPEEPLPMSPKLGNAILKRKGTTASHAAVGSSAALQYGTEIHAMLEELTWLDEQPFHSIGEKAAKIAALLDRDEWRELLERRNRIVELQREIPVEGVVDGEWVRGIIDRLHIFRNGSGDVTQVQILDYKTDRTDDPKILLAAHSGQMRIYRQLMAKALKISVQQVQSFLLGLHAGCIVDCDDR